MASFSSERQSAITPAKINLTLKVLGKRADGYHDIESVVAKITLYDGIDIFRGGDSAIQIECSDSAIPTDQHNFIWQAVRKLSDGLPFREPLLIKLYKLIPSGAGLGGGSSNAAMMLRMLNRRWNLGLSLPQLEELGAGIGSDVPLFLHNGSVFMRGRGEIVEPVTLPWSGWLVLVFPGYSISTAQVYQAFKPDRGLQQKDARQCLNSEYRQARRLDDVLFNDLEEGIVAVQPRLGQLKYEMEGQHHIRFHVTGSGSTLFACFDSFEEAEMMQKKITSPAEVRTQVVRVISNDEQQVRNNHGDFRSTRQTGQ